MNQYIARKFDEERGTYIDSYIEPSLIEMYFKFGYKIIKLVEVEITDIETEKQTVDEQIQMRKAAREASMPASIRGKMNE